LGPDAEPIWYDNLVVDTTPAAPVMHDLRGDCLALRSVEEGVDPD
jgi:hypothetical protein